MLTNVLHKEYGRWRGITADEVESDGSISVASGFFKCAKCGQFVTFVAENRRIPHFRHSRSEDKDCEDRAINDPTGGGTDVKIYFERKKKITLENNLNAHQYPLRIKVLENTVSFFIGLPREWIDKNSIKGDEVIFDPIRFSYIPESIMDKPCSYVVEERLSDKHVTFFVGNIPAVEYKIWVSKADHSSCTKSGEVRVDGVGIEEGQKITAVFSVKNGRHLPLDTQLKVGEPYYLLTEKKITRKCNKVEILPCNIDFFSGKNKNTAFRIRGIYLYQFVVNQYNADTAKFVRDICQDYYVLLPQRTELVPVWPAYFQCGGVYRYSGHDQSAGHDQSVFVFVQGDGKLEYYPHDEGPKKLFKDCTCPNSNGTTTNRVICVNGQDKYNNKIICVTSDNLDYFRVYNSIYLSSGTKKPSARCRPKVEVYTGRFANKQVVTSGRTESVPKNLRITSEFDGYVEIIEGKMTLRRESIKSGVEKIISGLKMGQSVRVFQGLDCSWKLLIRRKRKVRRRNIHDSSFLKHLIQCDGECEPFSMLLARRLIAKVKSARLRRWIFQQARKRTISSKALRLLKTYPQITR